MASFNNNRHWPSMFRSKHAAQPWQSQPDMTGSPPSLVSGGSTTTTGSLVNKHAFPGADDRTPDPKPRWNPRPEQIRILEAIFNSGMVNPPRDEIPRIRLRLQEYGPVGDANVFYWFQNRKARSKNKLRAAGSGRVAPARAPPARHVATALVTTPPPPPPQIIAHHQLLATPPVQQQQQQQQQQAPTSSSSSSSDRSSGSSRPARPAMSATEAMDLLGPLAAACPQVYYQGPPPVAASPSLKVQQDHVAASDETIHLSWPQGYCLSAAELATILGAQYVHVPAAVQPQPPQALPAVPFLGLCNEVVAAPPIIGHRSCGASWAPSALGHYWPSSGAADHHQICKNMAASNTETKGVTTHEDCAKPGLLQYDFGVSAAMDAASAAAVNPPLSASPPDAAVTVASVAAATAGLTGGLAATTAAAANAAITNYDLFQGGLADAVVAGGVTGAPDAAVVTAPPSPADPNEGGVAVLCIADSATGRSVVREVAAARHLDVRAQFGEAAVLFRYVGDGERPVHVPVDAVSGCTVEPLQHGVVYWVLV